jgi:hypothetical protein
VKQRGSDAQVVPEPLVRYRPGDWVGPANSLEWPTTHDLGRPPIRWAKARHKWASEHIHTEADFDRLLYGPDVVFPPDTNVRIDRDLTCVFSGHYEWRRPRTYA